MRQPVRWIGLAMIVAVAAWLRLADLADRPMHADEANQAVKLGHLLEGGEYRFDPRDHHGPTLYYLGLIPAWIRGQGTLADLDETTVRLTPACAGILGVLFLGLLLGRVSLAAGWSAAALMAVSPLAVYYSRYFVQETLLSTFFLLGLYAFVRWRHAGTWGWAIAAGGAVGLMLATKATAPLFVTLALVAFAAAWWIERAGRSDASTREQPRLDHQHVFAGIVVAAAVAALFYSSFFRNPDGLRDAIRTYSLMGERVAGGNAHDKSSLYYLELLGWKSSGGYVWNQLPSSILSLIGLLTILATRSPVGIFAAVYGLVWFLVVSLTPYKTPWILIHGVPVLAAWAALGASFWVTRGVVVRVIFMAVMAAVMGWQLTEVRTMVFRRPADPRNPLAYVHTSPDILRVQALAAASQPGPIRVITPEYWPLPWYLRGRQDVGYWSQVPAQCDAGLLLVAPAWAATVRERLTGSYEESYLGLRPGVILQVFRRTQVDSQRP